MGRRRDFIKSTAKAALAGTATFLVARIFKDRNPVPPAPPVLEVPSFRVGGTEGIFSLVRGKVPETAVRHAVDLAGGMQRFISKGDKVLLKVNCAFARPAWMGATTSPEVASELVKLCLEAGAGEVRITDFPINDPEVCFRKSGLMEAVEEAGGKVFLPDPSHFRKVKVSDKVIGSWEVYYEPLAWCDKLIGVPTVKSHNLCHASLAMKNWYGFIGGSRSRFHQDIHNVVAELGAFITPTLVVLDGSRVLFRNGPTGGSDRDVRPGEAIAVSTDQVAIEAFGAELLDIQPSSLEYISIAEAASVGLSDYRSLAHFQEDAV